MKAHDCRGLSSAADRRDLVPSSKAETVMAIVMRTLLEDSFTKHVRMVGTEGSLLLVDKNMDQYEKTSFLSMACRSEYRH
jgi:hypothetical protein